MKTMTIPATEVSQFWNILRRFCKDRRISVMFKNGNAIFTATLYGGSMLSYSAKYDGPDDDRTFSFWPAIAKHKTSGVDFTIDDRTSSGSLWHLYHLEGRSPAVQAQEAQEFDDISEDGVDTPADMPKIFSRLLKARRGVKDWRTDKLYFEGAPGWTQSFAIASSGVGLTHTRFPMLREYGFCIPSFPMKCLPGSGVMSFYYKDNSRMLCYQSGGWLYTTQTDSGFFNSSETRNDLLSNPSSSIPTIKIDKTDFKAIMVFTAAWTAYEWRRKKPIVTFKTDARGRISAEFVYCPAWHYDKPSPILLEKTQWIQNSVAKFSATLMELRNVMSAGFSEFKVQVVGDVATIKSESKGMRYVAKSQIL